MTGVTQHVAEAAAAMGAKTNYGASAGLFLLGLFTTEEWTVIAIVVGIFFAAAGFLTQSLMTWYFKSKSLRLEQRRIDAEIARNNANNQPVPADDSSFSSRNISEIDDRL